MSLSLCLIACFPAHAHTFHASLAQIEYSPSSKRAEIAIRLFTDDLENALSLRSGRRVRMDVTPSADRLALDYLREVFVLRGADGRPAKLSWVGMEATVNTVWVYVEADLPAGLGGARLTNAILFELFDDQVNTVNVRQGDGRASLVFQRGDGEKAVEWGGGAVGPPGAKKAAPGLYQGGV